MLVAICVSSLWRYLFISFVHILLDVSFLLINFKSFVYFRLESSSDMSFANIFSQTMAHLFVLLMVYFYRADV